MHPRALLEFLRVHRLAVQSSVSAGGVHATVKKLLETASGQHLPAVVLSTVYRQGVERPDSPPRVSARVTPVTPVGWGSESCGQTGRCGSGAGPGWTSPGYALL
jgi:hypothetical protein